MRLARCEQSPVGNTANGSGLQWATIRNIAMAWVLTLPAAMLISGALYFTFSRMS